MNAGKLDGLRILLVEDEYFQAREISEALEQEGAIVVGPTGRSDDVPALLERTTVDLALLDINLGSGPSFATAKLLKREGVPFAFLTGYDATSIPPELSAIPRIEKPAHDSQVIRLLAGLLC